MTATEMKTFEVRIYRDKGSQSYYGNYRGPGIETIVIEAKDLDDATLKAGMIAGNFGYSVYHY